MELFQGFLHLVYEVEPSHSILQRLVAVELLIHWQLKVQRNCQLVSVSAQIGVRNGDSTFELAQLSFGDYLHQN